MGNAHSSWLIIRTDTDSQAGWGHVMRCIALGQAWRDAGGRVAFLTATPGPELQRRLSAESFTLHAIPAAFPNAADLATTTKILSTHYPGSWRVLDGYHFDRNYQAGFRKGGAILVLSDGVEASGYEADALMNPDFEAAKLPYALPPGTVLLLGAQYFPLRQEIVRAAPRTETREHVRQILLSFGGADPLNLTPRALKTLGRFVDMKWEIIVVIGPHARNQNEITSAVRSSPHGVRVRQTVTDMAALMTQSDLAIVASGGTVFELAYLQVPTILVAVADNQRDTARCLASQGGALEVSLARFDEELFTAVEQLADHPERRHTMGQKARNLVDGQGAQRVCAALRQSRPDLK